MKKLGYLIAGGLFTALSAFCLFEYRWWGSLVGAALAALWFFAYYRECELDDQQ